MPDFNHEQLLKKQFPSRNCWQRHVGCDLCACCWFLSQLYWKKKVRQSSVVWILQICL